MIAGSGGYDYDEPVANSMHTQFGVNCVNSCHMAPTLGWVDEVGADAFELTSEDGVENVAACNKCHPPVVGFGLESFNSTAFNRRRAIGDYDGDGTLEGVQDEVQGLLDVLLEAIRASGVETLDHDPYWKDVTTEAQEAAIHNWSFVSHDGSLGVHNTARSVQLLQRSYKDLTGEDVPGADPYSHVMAPPVVSSTVTIIPLMEIEGVVDEEGKPIRTTALPGVGIGNYVLLKGFSQDISADNPAAAIEWTLTPPDGSAAALIEVDGEHVYFVADAPGWYEVKLAVTDSQDTVTEGVLRINSAPYVGVGSVTGAMAPAPQCASCHPAMAQSWAETAHASTLARKIDGGNDPTYPPFDESCLTCHTLGYNPAAENGGFDDVAAQVGWVLPEPEMQQPGNWDALPTELKHVAGVQCESCHGPGGRWIGTAISLSAESCGYCHDAPWRYVKNEQWSNSAHADATSRAFTYPITTGDASCMPCHSAEAFIDAMAGKEASLRRWAGRTGFQTVTCVVCHDSHSAEHEAQLRVYDTVTLPDGTAVTNAGASAVCMTCHNGRVGPDQIAEDEPHYPHYSTAAEMLVGTGGYDYGEAVADSAHNAMGMGCVDCHMASTPGWVGDEQGGEGLPGHDEVGAHTFNVTSRDGVENVAACTGCHPGLEEFNRTAADDYDGDGSVEGVQDEVQGLLDLLLEAIQASGVEYLDHYPYWENVTTEAQKAAIYNWSFVSHDNSLGVHNTARSVQLLRRSYKDLTGQDIPTSR
jgi:hypothetical protein